MKLPRYMVHQHTDIDQAYNDEEGDYYIETFASGENADGYKHCGRTLEVIVNKRRAYSICKLMNEGKIK